MLLEKEKDVYKKIKLRELTNASWRYLAYRAFMKWINSFVSLGRKNRIIIPSCCVTAIRMQWPEECGVYVGFLPPDEDDVLPS
jgi:hypothetical protein